MTEEKVANIFEMISAAGAARSKYMEAVSLAKEGKFEQAQEAVKEGGSLFSNAHHVHAEMLAQESRGMEEGVNSEVSLILVHAEDQMMCAESFRIIAEEFIDVYKKIEEKA